MTGGYLTFAPIDPAGFASAACVCLGTGRFLRAVLLPAMREMGSAVVIAQTRGTSFGEYMAERPDATYEVDVVLPTGPAIEAYAVAATGTLGTQGGRAAFMGLPALMPGLRIIGCGVTEAGIAAEGQAMLDLAEFLYHCWKAGLGTAAGLCVLNTDNMPHNGDKIKQFVSGCAFTTGLADSDAFLDFLGGSVSFHNTMVDRVVTQRDGEPMVPKAEELPLKAIVCEDLQRRLPKAFAGCKGVVVRTEPGALDLDLALKLRILNGTHSAMVYLMGLARLPKTDDCVGHPHLLPYLRRLFEHDIVAMQTTYSGELERSVIDAVFAEWMVRLTNPEFGLSTFWVSQNAGDKLGIRFVPTILSTLEEGREPSQWMAFAVAAMLRFLTPAPGAPRAGPSGVWTGRMDAAGDVSPEGGREEYVDGMGFDLGAGTYEFKDGDGSLVELLLPLSAAPAEGGPSLVQTKRTVTEVFTRYEGLRGVGGVHGVAHAEATGRGIARFGARVAGLLHRMLAGETAMGILAEMDPGGQSPPTSSL
jgi:mannitol-1-phosphate/altronate dehydrogenase